jgi:hypothetical protein
MSKNKRFGAFGIEPIQTASTIVGFDIFTLRTKYFLVGLLPLTLGLSLMAQDKLDSSAPPAYVVNSRQYGAKQPETFVTLQNRHGLRIEYCVDRATLSLWISPQAWKSMSSVDRNWSCRDDHTDVFERIRFDGLNMSDFRGCDYDAFHAVLKFKNRKIHLLNIYDAPAVAIWIEGEEAKIDFKATRGDQPESVNPKEFIVEHAVLGRKFDFAAVIGIGASRFGHQLDSDPYRSRYASAHLKANELLVIGAELQKEQVANTVRNLSQTDIPTLLARNQAKVDAALQFGKITLKNKPELQKVLEVNRAVALSMQDGGAMRSTSQYIYYLLWVRDGGMNTSTLGLSGWLNPARDQSAYALLNPSISTTEPFKGKYFGQLLAGNINKWEEDGLFYAVWPMFSYWSYSGDTKFLHGEYIQNVTAAVEWLEKYCYSSEKHLFGRYYYCENAYFQSRDYGYDNAVGNESGASPYKFHGDTVFQAYDLYINSLMYSTYLMLAAALPGEKGDAYLQKAMTLEKGITRLYNAYAPLPSYGEYRLSDGRFALAEAYGADITDYQWALSIPPFLPCAPEILKNARNALLSDILNKKFNFFICGVGDVLCSLDTEIHDEDSIMKVLDDIVERSKPAGKYLPMAYTIPEMTKSPDGDPFHDVRPIVFSIGPVVGATANLGFRRLPFGMAPRSTKYIDKIENIQYLQKLVSLDFEGVGPINHIQVGEKTLRHSYQIPDQWLNSETNRIIVKMDNEPAGDDILISSTVRLLNVQEDGPISFQIKGYGKDLLTFKNLMKGVSVVDSKGAEVSHTNQKMGPLTYIEFSGTDAYTVRLQ